MSRDDSDKPAAPAPPSARLPSDDAPRARRGERPARRPSRASFRLIVSFLLALTIASATILTPLPLGMLWIGCALIAVRFAVHEREERAALAMAVATGCLLWLFALLAMRPLEAIALGAAPIFGAGIAWKRRIAAVPIDSVPRLAAGAMTIDEAIDSFGDHERDDAPGDDEPRPPRRVAIISANPATVLYRGVGLHLAALLSFVLLTPAFLAAAGHPDRGYLAGEMRPIWQSTVEEVRAQLQLITMMQPEAQRADFEEFARRANAEIAREDASFLLVNHLLFMTLLTAILAIGLPMGRRIGYELATLKATEREMILVIVALAFHLIAPRIGEGELAMVARPVWWSVASLVWLQAIALAAYQWQMARVTGQKLLYFTSALGVVLFVLWRMGGFIIGLADVYLDIRKKSARAGAPGPSS